MSSQSSQPIGIFDSGIGGLTVANAIAQVLPNESLIYFGDTAHHPYGEKSQVTIQAYTVKICDMLLQQHCKLILIACHSASSAAYELAKEYVGGKAKVMNVIDPAIAHIREHFSQRRIGIIGTKQTIYSNIYKKKIDDLHLDIDLRSLATPLLAPMIEEGFANNQILVHILADYLSHSELTNIDALLLACTHYPLIKKQIEQYYENKVQLIDSAEITAQALKGLLTHDQMLNKSKEREYKFYVSDYTDSFVASAKIFFPETVHFEHYPLWE